jgi:hypothetical protein
MDYNTAVREKLARRKEAGITASLIDTEVKLDHEYKRTTYTQTNYEDRKFLWYNYKKKISEQIIPVELCQVCKKLEIEHI